MKIVQSNGRRHSTTPCLELSILVSTAFKQHFKQLVKENLHKHKQNTKDCKHTQSEMVHETQVTLKYRATLANFVYSPTPSLSKQKNFHTSKNHSIQTIKHRKQIASLHMYTLKVFTGTKIK